jgi:hypothetical protein
MSSKPSFRFYLLVATSLPVYPADALEPLSSDLDLHVQVERKLRDAEGRVTITDQFLNAAMLGSHDEDFLRSKRNAFALHRLPALKTPWVTAAGDDSWRQRLLRRIATHARFKNQALYLR